MNATNHNPTDTARISIGNAERFQTTPTRGWFLGPFIDPDLGVRHSPVEVKWSTHPPGDGRTDISPGGDAATVTILVSGKFELSFPCETPGQVILARPGDYAVYGPGVAHTWRAIDESVVLTVRWRDR